MYVNVRVKERERKRIRVCECACVVKWQREVGETGRQTEKTRRRGRTITRNMQIPFTV